MNRRSFLAAALSALVLPALVPVEAQAQGGWVLLGVRQVNGAYDRDRIPVGAQAGSFRKLRLKVRGNDLLIDDFDVVFSNGGHQDISVRSFIRQGGYTRALDLKGKARGIRHVTFKYGKFANGRGRTWVELWAWR